MKKIITIFLIFLFGSTLMFSQGFEREFKDLVSFGQENSHLVKNRDGSFAFCAVSTDSITNKQSLTLTKLYPDGNVQWCRSYSSDTFNLGSVSIDTLIDQTYILASIHSYSYGSLYSTIISLSKIDSAGIILWTKRITVYPTISAGAANISDCDVKCDPNGGFALVWGDYTSYNSPIVNFQKFSNNGVLLWQQSYSANLQGINLQHFINGGWIIYGYLDYFKGYNILRTDSIGGITDDFSVGRAGGRHLIALSDSSIIVQHEGSIARIDKFHNIVWAFNSPFYIGRMKLKNDSIIEMLGMHYTGYVIKQKININNGDLSGRKIYTKYNSGSNYLSGFDIENTKDGGSLYTYAYTGSIHLVKTDSLGNTGCQQTDEFSSSFELYHYPVNVYINEYSFPSLIKNYFITPTTFNYKKEYYTEVNSCCTANLEIIADFYGICKGTTVSMNAQGMPSYIWSNGISDTSINVTVNTDTMFTVIGSNSCITHSDTIKIHPDENPNISLVSDKDTICYGESVHLSSFGSYAGVSWNFHVNYPINDTVMYSPDTSGYYIVNGEIDYGMYSMTCQTKDSVFIFVEPVPMIPVLTRSHDTLFSSALTGNQWYNNGIVIPGETNNYYKMLTTGNYSVSVTNSQGCSEYSAECSCLLIGIDELISSSISIYPNPANDNIYVNGNDNNFRVEIMDVYGKQLMFYNSIRTFELNINVSQLSAGIYFMKFISDKGITVKTFAKQ